MSKASFDNSFNPNVSVPATESYPPDSAIAFQVKVPDLGPLRMSVLSKSAGVDRFLCQYEVPGGGICRDKTCTDLHLGDAKVSGKYNSAHRCRSLAEFPHQTKISLRISKARWAITLRNLVPRTSKATLRRLAASWLSTEALRTPSRWRTWLATLL